MNQADRAAIEGLFKRIARVAQRSGPRDRGAEALIQCEIDAQPAAPYYMAQTIIMQEKALNEAQQRIEELEGREQEGFSRRGTAAGPWSASPFQPGGGFLAGAAQTAMGVAGGVLLGNMLADWLTPDPAAADASESAGLFSEPGTDTPDTQIADVGDFGGGGFDFGDF